MARHLIASRDIPQIEWKALTFIPRPTGRETREDDTSNKSDDRKREKGSIGRRKGSGGQKERETFCCAWCISFKAYGEPLGLVAITMRRALEFKISRIGARSIHLRDNIFRSKYEYYIISAADAGFSPFLLVPHLLSPSFHPPPPLPLPRESL